ncbi:17224_t:CDS:1, partial [Dentiscutata heterogama]
AFEILKARMPSEASDLILWFENNYIGGVRSSSQNEDIVVRSLPLFSPRLWSVYELIELGIPRTQNNVEAWHNRWNTLVGKKHVSIDTLISELQKEQLHVDTQIERILRGEPRPKQNIYYIEKERRMMEIFNDQENRPVMDFL